jgi:hypothetical protein
MHEKLIDIIGILSIKTIVLTKMKCINVLIISSLLFFIGVTTYLLYLLIQNSIVLIHNYDTTDIILVVIILAGWISFVVAIMTKAIQIYRKIPNE